MTTLDTPIDPSAQTTNLIAGFPFPFPEDQYRYSTNVEPADTTVTTAGGQWGRAVVDIDDEYHDELDARAEVLDADPSRYAVLPYMQPAAWDAMLTLMREFAAAYPRHMSLTSLGDDRWAWHNALLDIDQVFTYADASTLPDEPLRYIGFQMQEDVALLDQRDEQLFVDAGLITFAADWSFGFDVGMSFLEIHGPVPRVRKMGVITRAHEFLKRLQPHHPYRRTNWTMTIGRRLDVSTERYPEWGPDREMIQTVDDETFGSLVHLRVEVQHLIRLPDSGAIMFLIRTYLLPLEQLATVEDWRVRAASVFAELPDDMADYKGIIKYRTRAAEWLRAATPPTAEPIAGLPIWPKRPIQIDDTAAGFLIVAAGTDAEVSHVARAWVAAAEAVAPTRLLVVDSLADAADRQHLVDALGETTTGSRIHIVGGQYDVLTALAIARDEGAIAAELEAFVTHTRDLPLYCAHCRDTFRVDGTPGSTVTCPGCARVLEIHTHHSAALGSFLASAAGE